MQRVMTLSERKATEVSRPAKAVQALIPVLADHARQRGGRLLLFGSAARGAMKSDSDVDILMDFPPDALQAAWGFAETACWDRDLSPEQTTEERHLVEMDCMHAMQSSHTSLEVMPLRIFDLRQDAAPTDATWHADLIRRVQATSVDAW